MNNLYPLLAVFLLAACVQITGPEAPEGATFCTEAQKQAEICTMEYAPVCGSDGETYGNKCVACASGKIDWWVAGKCTSRENCSLEPETGPCKAYFKKYYYSQTTNQCEEFVWGGCQGVVPFQTLEECQQACES